MTLYPPQWLQAGSYAAGVDRRLIGALWPGPASSGCAVSPSSLMTLNVAAGQVAVPSPNNTGSTLCTSDAVATVTLTAASGSNPRIDLVTCHPRGADLDGGTNNDFIFDFITGTPAASPAVPATPAGQVALAQIYVGTGVTSIVAGNITDVRPGFLGISNPQTVQRYQFRGYRAAALTGPATANTPFQFICDTKVFDPAGCYSTSTGLYTCPAAGLYLFRGQLSFSLTAAGNCASYAYRNGANDTSSVITATAAATTMPQNVQLFSCAAGDTLALWGQSSIASVPVRVNTPESGLSIAYLGPP
ncbi:MAG TPA: hypothetical protein VGH66_13965 [Acidimicrobiales bacterium]